MNRKIVYTTNFRSLIQTFLENPCVLGTVLETKSPKMNKFAPGPPVADGLVLAN